MNMIHHRIPPTTIKERMESELRIARDIQMSMMCLNIKDTTE